MPSRVSGSGRIARVDDHQRAMWSRMLDRLHAFENDEIDLTNLVQDLRGLFIEADPHRADVREGFELRWSELEMNDELRTQPWAPRGSYDEAGLRRGIESLREWVTTSVLADFTTDHN